MRNRDRGRGRFALLALVAGGALLAGCASMPESGEVTSVDSSQHADADSQVRVYGVPPRRNERPEDLVNGFLEATTSDDPDYATARMYLAKSARQQWNPSASTTILTEMPKVRRERSGDRESGLLITLTGKQLARVDDKHAYKPDERPFQTGIHLAQEGGEWRIDSPPPGLVLGVSDFQRIYRSVNKFYFAELGAGGDGQSRDVLVADPVYLRRRIDPVTSTVNALLDGPTTWLDPAVATAFPPHTRLKGNRLSLDDSNALKVRLDFDGRGAGQEQCLRMAAQLLYTAQESARVNSVTVQNGTGRELCRLDRDEAKYYAPERIAGRPDRVYFIDGHHRLVSLADGDEEPRRVPGPFGADGVAPLRSVAVDRAERRAAGVSANGQTLHITELTPGASAGEARLTVHGGPKAGLSQPSWDGMGDLWVADQDPDRPRLLRLPGGTGSPEEVPLPSLGGGRISGVRVAADGVRIALLITKGDRTALWLGRVDRHGGGSKPVELSVADLRAVAPRLVDVDGVSWAGGSRLLVAGSEQGGLPQLQFVETDGSTSNSSTLPGITGVGGVAAPDTPGKAQALLAERDGGLVRLLPDTNWKPVPGEGSAPVYPG
ncbi:LpqB family beta-propeller domain-containing protein [Streptomyces sp. NPDC052396]|uniref:LpqB family beta-propeller domain-containing protein n=1 Tax=Streptomyces sp. NPDC052396 TaxID=3365689 RepID=UPI0037D3FEF6